MWFSNASCVLLPCSSKFTPSAFDMVIELFIVSSGERLPPFWRLWVTLTLLLLMKQLMAVIESELK